MPVDDPSLTPEQDREVRRLLADARHAEPVPGDVAARLDRVLAELARGENGDLTPVTVLASRRRQRVTSLLVAAAAVVAVGIGLGQVVGTRGGSDSDSPSTAADAGVSAEQAAPEAGDAKERDAAGGTARQEAPAPSYAVPTPVQVRADRFSDDVETARALALMTLDSAYASSSGTDGRTTTDALAFECTAAEWGAGTFVPVTYGGDAGVLVFRRAAGDTQVVDLFTCGSAEVVRSITLPAP